MPGIRMSPWPGPIQSVGQIAAAFQTSVDAVYKLKQRMRDKIKAQVATQIAEEDDPGE